MPVKLNVNGVENWFDISEKEDSDIFLKDDSNREIKIQTPLDIDPLFKEKDFEIHFLAKKNVRENEIYQVYLRATDIRIGWIIPTISLSSDLHDYSDNEHFLRYAYVGIRESLKLLNENIYSESVFVDESECRYSEIFHEETVLLILSKETFPGRSIEIDRIIPSLMKHGYLVLTDRNPSQIKHEASNPEKNRVYIDEIAEDIKHCSLISGLLNGSFAYEKKAVFKFFYIYQIFELLIDYVYQNEQEALIEALVESKGDAGLTKDALDNMQKFMSEKKRIGLLTSKYADITGSTTALKARCNQLLDALGRQPCENFEGYFYRIRNFIFHQYRDFPGDANELLEEVISELVELLPSLLSKFKLPN